MAGLTISSAASLTGATTASGDLFPCLDVSAASGSQGSKITRDELGDAMTRTAAMIAALAAKLDAAGGTMTGALVNSTNGAASTSVLQLTGTPFTGGTATTTKPLALFETTGATSNNWSTSGTMLGVNAPSGFAGSIIDAQVNGARKFSVNASSGALRLNADTQDTIWRRTDIGMLIFHGENSNSTGVGSGGMNPGLNLGRAASVRWTNDVPAAAPDIILSRAAAACLQMGDNHATTPTTQTIKAHNVTTGSGAALKLCGGSGSIASGAVYVADSTDMPAGFHGVANTQDTTAVSAQTFLENTGTTVNDASTFGGYTIGQVVTALKNKGILA